jgi:hypothetical protein
MIWSLNHSPSSVPLFSHSSFVSLAIFVVVVVVLFSRTPEVLSYLWDFASTFFSWHFS